jgi:cyclopropane fatty-acyl-phospholipid synthase-like methyltransferase
MSLPNHFDSIAEVFNRIWYFSDEYKNFVITHILSDLVLTDQDILIDIGGGTGSFTSRLALEANLRKAYCVEPSRAMCDEASKLENINAVCSDAHTFLASHTPFTKMLFKEVIHHIKDRDLFWKAVYELLPHNGKLLIITRPQRVEFPFFTAAKEAFARHQPPQELIESELRNGGFETTTHHRSHTFTLPKEDWYTMLRHRFMSDLGVFSDAEIEEGIKEIEHDHPYETIDIVDHLLFILATKPQ